MYYLRGDYRKRMKQKIIVIILILIALIVISAVIAYLIFQNEKPWLAFYIACCAGVLIVNLFIVVIFVNKNLKNNKKFDDKISE